MRKQSRRLQPPSGREQLTLAQVQPKSQRRALTLQRAQDARVGREQRRDAMRVMHEMAQALKDGHCVAVFPEGTTGDGRALLPFHANLLPV